MPTAVWRLALPMLIALTPSVGAPQQEATQAGADPLADYKPVHQLSFPGNPRIISAAFSADGRSILVHLSDQSINVWEVLVHYWPEVLGTFTAGAMLGVGFVLLRISRQQQVVGEPHCRHCGYCLKDCQSGCCPECGRSVRRPVIARPRWRRMLPWTALLGVVVLGYGSLWALRVPRTNRANAWVNWWSHDLLKWADERNIAWLVARAQFVSRIVEVDVGTGATLRTLFTCRPSTWDFRIKVTPDGAGLLTPVPDRDRLALISTSSGRVLRTLAHDDPGTGADEVVGRRSLASMTPGGPRMSLCSVGRRRKPGCWRGTWNPASARSCWRATRRCTCPVRARGW